MHETGCPAFHRPVFTSKELLWWLVNVITCCLCKQRRFFFKFSDGRTLGSRSHNTVSCTRANAINISASGWEALAESVVFTISMRSGDKLLKSMSPFWSVAVLACCRFGCHCLELLSIWAIMSLKNGKAPNYDNLDKPIMGNTFIAAVNAGGHNGQ